MRSLLTPSLVVAVLLAAQPGARADDVSAILEKAVKAHGGADRLKKQHTIQTKSKGTIELLGGIAFTDESTVQPPDQIKTSTQIEVNGQTVTVSVVFDKDKGWVQAAGQTMDMDEKTAAEMKEVLHLTELNRIFGLKDKADEVSLIGDDKVDGRDVVGIRVSSKGYKDVSLYFDKQTGLVAKVARQAYDAQSGQEVSEERIIQEYQEVDGLKVAKKLVVNRDGKKFMDIEVTDVKFIDRVDDSTFAKP